MNYQVNFNHGELYRLLEIMEDEYTRLKSSIDRYKDDDFLSNNIEDYISHDIYHKLKQSFTND